MLVMKMIQSLVAFSEKNMMNSFKKIAISLTTVATLFVIPAVMMTSISSVANAAEQEGATKQRASKKVPAMRNRVYSQLARAQKLADEGNKAEGLAVLGEVKERIEQLNSYEKAMLWNFYGFMYYGDDDLVNAISSFEKVVAQEAIPESLYLSTTYSLAQLAMQQEDYKKHWLF